jgi:hypothetical protein
MTSPENPSPRPPVGATPVGGKERKRRPAWLIPLIAAIAAVIVLLLLLSQCGTNGDDGDTSGAGATSSADADDSSGSAQSGSRSGSPSSSAAGQGNAASVGQPGTITANGTAVLPAAGANPGGALAAFAGQPAQGAAVQVLLVPADEGFWVGSSDTERVWVQLTGEGESAYQVQAGDTVDFEGTVVAHPGGFSEQVGITEADGAAQLTQQGHHIEVDKAAVSLSE